jgi:hypothetical protein
MEGRQVRQERGELTDNLVVHLKDYRPDFASMNGCKEIDRRWSSESSGGRWEVLKGYVDSERIRTAIYF